MNKLLLPLILLGLPFFVQAQISLNISTTDSDCSANGSMTIVANGGNGNYVYKISCPSYPEVTSSQNTFTALPACSYTVTVNDGTGLSATKTVEIGGQYTLPNASIIEGGCSLGAKVTGGKLPYTYAISTVGLNGPFSPAQTQYFFDSIPQGTYWIRATDACGNIKTAAGNVGLVNKLDFTSSSDANGLVVNIKAGSPPFTFRLSSSNGTFTNNTGIFTVDQMGCQMKMKVTDACGTILDKDADPQLGGNVLCVKFLDGSAQIIGTGGTPPYQYSCITTMGTINSPDGNFTTLPLNVPSYAFRIKDACGKTYNGLTVNNYSLNLPIDIAACNDQTVGFNLWRGCQQLRYINTPVTFTCPTCVGVSSVTLTNKVDTVYLTGATPGNIIINAVDNCGDIISCRDSIKLIVSEGCDSLVARLADWFYCSNGQTSYRYLTSPGATFDLLLTNGTVLQSGNTTGIFTGFPAGNYKIRANSPTCGTHLAIGKIVGAETINPNWKASITVKNDQNGRCSPFYSFQVPKTGGPFVLTGGPENVRILLDEDNADFSCANYIINDLLPGQYTLWSRSKCGSIPIPLPTPETQFNLTATLTNDCPNGAAITVTGAKSKVEWQDWATMNGLNWDPLLYTQGYKDHYEINDPRPSSSSPHDGSPYTFINLDPGPQTIYLFPFGGECPVDSAKIIVPATKALTVEVPDNFICDGQTTMTTTFKILGGKAPFHLQRLDCSDPSITLEEWSSMDSLFLVSGLAVGQHCFRMIDSCGASKLYSISAGYFSDTIQRSYTCDGMLHLATQNFPFDYAWKNTDGQILGNTFNLDVVAPSTEDAFSVNIHWGTCDIIRQINLPYKEITPSITLTPSKTAVCGDENVIISLTALPGEILWNTGSDQSEITVEQQGVYTVTITNDIGCSATSSQSILFSPEQAPTINGATIYCEGLSTPLVATGPYTDFYWSNGQTGGELLVNTPGDYTAFATDALGCVWEKSITITEIPNPKPNITGLNTICENATTLIDAGSDYAVYAWSNGSNSQFNEVVAGTYEVTVTNANNCTGKASFEITAIPLFDVNLTPDTTVCQGDSIILHFNIPGADVAKVFWSIDGGSKSIQDIQFGEGQWTVPSADHTYSIDSVAITGYKCPFKGLPAQTKVITDKLLGTANVLAKDNGFGVSCHGYSDGVLEVNMTAGVAPFTYQWDNANTGAKLEGLESGTYSVTVTDALGCTATQSVEITQPGTLNVSIAAFAPICYGVKNGIIAVDLVENAYGQARFSVNGQNWVNAPGEEDKMPSGDYALTIKDEMGCQFDTLIQFDTPFQYELELSEKSITVALGDTVELKATTNIFSPDSISWSQPVFAPNALQTQIKPTVDAIYELKVWTPEGCLLTDKVKVYVERIIPVFVPTAFKPNDVTSENDRFLVMVKPAAVEAIQYLQVFDRWGNMVFSIKNPAKNNKMDGWDGTYKGKDAPEGVYIWQARVDLSDGTSEKFEGDVYLSR